MTHYLKRLIKKLFGVIWYCRPNKYELTVIVLSWNRAHLTQLCIQSLIQNGPVDLQIFVVDNASRPEERKELRRFLNQTGRPIHVLWLTKNHGGSAFNFVSWRATGKYILFSENDLKYSPGYFEKMKSLFEADPLLGQLSPLSAIPQYEKGEMWTTKSGKLTQVGNGSYYETFTNVGSTSLVLRKILRTGIFWRNISTQNSTFRFPDDGNFSTQIRNHGYKIAWIETPMADNLGHQVQEWENNPGYYLENWGIKSQLGIDSYTKNASQVDFSKEKEKQVQHSLRSQQIQLQRTSPHLVDKSKIIPEVGRMFINQGQGFRNSDFIDFEYFLDLNTNINININDNTVLSVRIDPIDCPCFLRISNLQAFSFHDENLVIFDSNHSPIIGELNLKSRYEKPEITLIAQRPIKKIQLNLYVKLFS